MKYGGLSETEALKLVTLNPAKQLRIDNKVGSLEAGKDADFVVWSGDPLSNYTHANQTWIDGRKYFDRAADIEGRKAYAQQREALVQKALAERMKEIGKPKDGGDKKDGDKPAKPDTDVYSDGSARYECTDEE